MGSKRRLKYNPGQIINGIKFIREIEPYIELNGSRKRRGVFECPYCGAEFTSVLTNIVSGNTKSCGCIAGGGDYNGNGSSNVKRINRVRKEIEAEGYELITDVSKRLGVDRSVVWRYVRSYNAPSKKVGRLVCVKVDKSIENAILEAKKRRDERSKKPGKNPFVERGIITDFYGWMQFDGYRSIMLDYNRSANHSIESRLVDMKVSLPQSKHRGHRQ